jgi:hypothetical protein
MKHPCNILCNGEALMKRSEINTNDQNMGVPSACYLFIELQQFEH